MEKIIIQHKPVVEQYLNNLVNILFREEYFGYEESALAYVQKMRETAETKIITQKHKQTPEVLIVYGEFYVSYKTNKRTAWYIFFSRKGNRVLVKHITNNHVADADFLQHL